MAKKKVTLRAPLKHGTFYWVADVQADSDDEAVVAAENLFLNEVEQINEWTFDDFDVE